MKKMKISKKAKKNIDAISCYLAYKKNPQKYIPVRASIFFSKGNISHFNWGDDMNYYLVGLMSKKKYMHIPNARILKALPIDSYLIIGSTITFYPLDHLTIWGSGIINQNETDRITGKPNRICAVRGPLTRDILMKKGYDCPEVYGDPILLLPRFYTPEKTEKKYRIGIVPHFTDKDLPVVRELAKEDTVIMDIQNYSRWQDFVDQICSCRFILSSSLHGLICSEAYGIPSAWVGFSDYKDGWDFKFRDFYMSVQKPDMNMQKIRKAEDAENIILSGLNEWHPGRIDSDKLLNACPFWENN